MKYLLLLTLGVSSLTGYLLWQTPDQLEPKAFQKALLKNTDALLLDVRTSLEFSSGHLPGAMNVDWLSPAFRWRIAELDTSRAVFLYCKAGGRSSAAAVFLREQGFGRVTELYGGIEQWHAEDLPETPGELIPPAELTFKEFSRMLDLEHHVFVDFYIPWDTNCRKMEPIVDELQIRYYGKVKFMRINIDTYKYLATEMGIENAPVFHFYENGNLTFEWEGVTKRTVIEKSISSYVYHAIVTSDQP